VQHARKGTLEYHRKYIDIHVPLTEGETIGFTSICAAEAPGYNEEQDYGLLEAADAQQITLPAGWFCLCFPDDAHEPSVGEAGKTYRKMVWKFRV